MSIFLILPLCLLGGGAIISLLVARFRPRSAVGTAAIFATAASGAWVIAGQNLPLEPQEKLGDLPAALDAARFSVDELAWWMTLSVLILVLSSLLLMLTANQSIR
ncbi:MAG: hypothetical protein ACK2T3_15945, partial [Candidatus Promineifilaceae bacterium]